MTERLISILIGYVFGLFQTSYIIGKMHKTDIREHGSGNAGTTNALRTFGKKAGAMTLIGDCFKCVLAIVVVRLIFADRTAEMIPLLCIYAAAGCILGHNFPITLGFRGGKGIAASVGFLIAFVCDLCSGVFSTFLYDALCFFMLADILSGSSDCDDRIWRNQWIWYGQNTYDGNVSRDGSAYCTGILASQSKYCTIIKRNRKQGLSE